jgi:hypothetical protein
MEAKILDEIFNDNIFRSSKMATAIVGYTILEETDEIGLINDFESVLQIFSTEEMAIKFLEKTNRFRRTLIPMKEELKIFLMCESFEDETEEFWRKEYKDFYIEVVKINKECFHLNINEYEGRAFAYETFSESALVYEIKEVTNILENSSKEEVFNYIRNNRYDEEISD